MKGQYHCLNGTQGTTLSFDRESAVSGGQESKHITLGSQEGEKETIYTSI